MTSLLNWHWLNQCVLLRFHGFILFREVRDGPDRAAQYHILLLQVGLISNRALGCLRSTDEQYVEIRFTLDMPEGLFCPDTWREQANIVPPLGNYKLN
jgi:hypothetical protein